MLVYIVRRQNSIPFVSFNKFHGRKFSSMSGLDRFLSAQDGCLTDVENELRTGRKTSHWIWYIFPQRAGLGSSYNSQYYGLKDESELCDYIKHETLGPRYFGMISTVHSWLVKEKITPTRLMGSSIDVVKLRSSIGSFYFACRTIEPKTEAMVKFMEQADEIATTLNWTLQP